MPRREPTRERCERKVARLRARVAKGPARGGLFQALGKAHLELARLDEGATAGAEAALRAAVRIEPGCAWHHIYLGHVFYRSDRDRRALAAFTYALTLMPDDAMILGL